METLQALLLELLAALILRPTRGIGEACAEIYLEAGHSMGKVSARPIADGAYLGESHMGVLFESEATYKWKCGREVYLHEVRLIRDHEERVEWYWHSHSTLEGFGGGAHITPHTYVTLDGTKHSLIKDGEAWYIKETGDQLVEAPLPLYKLADDDKACELRTIREEAARGRSSLDQELTGYGLVHDFINRRMAAVAQRETNHVSDEDSDGESVDYELGYCDSVAITDKPVTAPYYAVVDGRAMSIDAYCDDVRYFSKNDKYETFNGLSSDQISLTFYENGRYLGYEVFKAIKAPYFNVKTKRVEWKRVADHRVTQYVRALLRDDDYNKLTVGVSSNGKTYVDAWFDGTQFGGVFHETPSCLVGKNPRDITLYVRTYFEWKDEHMLEAMLKDPQYKEQAIATLKARSIR